MLLRSRFRPTVLALAATLPACKTQDVGTESLARSEGQMPDEAPQPQVAAAPETDDVEIDAELGEKLWDGEAEATQAIADSISGRINRDYPADKRPARRDAHPKAHGCVRADFTVDPNVPAELAHGIFQPGKSYKSWIRFSNGDGDPTRADGKGDARGMAIKVTGVPGQKILPTERDGTTQDFIMINHPVFFVDDPQAYLSLMNKFNSTNPLIQLTAPAALGVKGTLIAKAIASKKIANPLHTRFFSMVPYRLGNDAQKQAVKFSAKPCQENANSAPWISSDADYLRKAMTKSLADGEGCFDFLIQARTTPSMSVESSMKEWKESEAPFVKVATIKIPKQTFDSAAQMTFCENLSYTPWHSLPEHRPLGGVNRVRRVVYEQISKLRHGLNGVARAEPTGDETF